VYFGYSIAKLGTPSTSMQGRAFQFHETAQHRLGPLYPSDGALNYLGSRPQVWAVAVAIPGLVLLWRRRRWLGAYAAAGWLAYVLLLSLVTPGSYDTGRYLLPVAPFVVVAAAAALRPLVSFARPALALAAIALAALLIVRPAARVPLDSADALQRGPYDFDRVVHRDAVAYVNRLGAPGDRVLAYEVQARYFLRPDLRMLSLDGITDGRVAPYTHDIAGFLHRYRPSWWIVDTSTDRGGRRYLDHSVLGQVAQRLTADPALRDTTGAGVRFSVVARRPGRLPYRFGAWRMIVRLSYPSRA
jgi:hypothetical protein